KRRVIEGCSVLLRPAVGEGVGQEVDQRGLLARGEVARLNPLGLLRVREVTAPAVEVDHVTERRLPTVVEVGCGELDVAQRRGLEGAVVLGGPAHRERYAVGARARTAGILCRRPHADVMEALVAAVLVDKAARGCETDRGVGHLGAGMA